MERTVRSHIAELERVLLQLNEELMQEDDVRVRNVLESRVRAAVQALQYFRGALEIEQFLQENQ